MRLLSVKGRKSKIKKQLYILYLLGIFLPILLIGGILTRNTRKIMMEQYNARMKSDNLRVRGIMMDLTTGVDIVGSFFFSDNELSSIINKSGRDESELYDYYRYYGYFDIYKKNHTELSRIEFYLDTTVEYGSFKKVTKDIMEKSWYQNAISVPQPIWVSMTYLNNMGVKDQELWYIRRIPIISTGKYGVLVLTIDNNHLKSRISNNELQTDITVNQDNVFYSELGVKGEPVQVSIDYEQTYYSYSGEKQMDGNRVLVEVSTLIPVASADKVYIITYDFLAYMQVGSVVNTFLLIIAISIFVPFVIFFIYTHSFSNRLLTLRHAMHKAGSGDYHVTDMVKGNDELADVFIDMSKMIESITKMDEEIYSSKLKAEQLNTHQQRIQYAMLASQINPHFLYNTLETIRMKAFSNNDKEVADAIKLLGKSMRHVLEHSMHTVDLKSELDYIEVYLQIQHIRFGDRIRYDIRISEEIDVVHYYILPLLLQPIVENAVLHGLESLTSVGDLLIHLEYAEEKLCISVEDNGLGMSKKELNDSIAHMKQDNINPEINSIGLNNIYHRIRLFYGEEYGIVIESEQGFGTRVKLYLPKNSDMQLDLSQMG